MKSSRILIQKRQEDLLDYLRSQPTATAEQLAEELCVSPATIRRDIRSLKQRGDIQMQFGTSQAAEALRILPSFDDDRYAMSLLKERQAIARSAAELIQDGDTVFLNSSFTALQVIPYIVDKQVILVTNNGRSLMMTRNPGTQLLLTGGEIPFQQGPNSKMSLTGELAVNAIGKITANKCILGVSGISVQGGLSSMAVQEPAINRAMIQRCSGPVIILADHRKIGIVHNFHFADIEDIHCLITDSPRNKTELSHMQRRGVDVRITSVDAP